MNLLIIASEYPPNASGVGMVVNFMQKKLKELGYSPSICSTSGPHYFVANWSLIKRFKGAGLLFFWVLAILKIKKISAKKKRIVWLHDPLCWIPKKLANKTLCTVHTTYLGYYRLSKTLNYNLAYKIYYYIMYIVQKYCLRKLYYAGVKFTCLTSEVQGELMDMGIKIESQDIINNGVDTNLFYPINSNDKQKMRSEFGINNKTNIFLFVGRLTGQKRPVLMVKIFKEVQKFLPNSILVIVGSGELYDVVSKEADGYNVYMVGKKTKNDLIKYYQMADFFLITSLYEGEPLVALEALSTNLPLICSNIPSLKNLVIESDSGILINPNDIYKSAQNIVNFINIYKKHKKTPREFVVENRDWVIIANKYINKIKELND